MTEQAETARTGDDDGQARETRRGRVRRLFVDPMMDLGFRRPPKIDEETFKKKITRMCDCLAYMSDDGLGVLFGMMRTKGQGRDRGQWPTRAMIYTYAEMIEPCPLEQIPNLLGWFRNNPGKLADQDGTLVETLEYFIQHKRPPAIPGAQAVIRGTAEDNRRQLANARNRIAEGRPDPDDAQFVAWYEARLARARALMRGETAPQPEFRHKTAEVTA